MEAALSSCEISNIDICSVGGRRSDEVCSRMREARSVVTKCRHPVIDQTWSVYSSREIAWGMFLCMFTE